MVAPPIAFAATAGCMPPRIAKAPLTVAAGVSSRPTMSTPTAPAACARGSRASAPARVAARAPGRRRLHGGGRCRPELVGHGIAAQHGRRRAIGSWRREEHGHLAADHRRVERDRRVAPPTGEHGRHVGQVGAAADAAVGAGRHRNPLRALGERRARGVEARRGAVESERAERKVLEVRPVVPRRLEAEPLELARDVVGALVVAQLTDPPAQPSSRRRIRRGGCAGRWR